MASFNKNAETRSSAKEVLSLSFGNHYLILGWNPATPTKIDIGIGVDDGPSCTSVTINDLSPANIKRISSALKDYADRAERADKASRGDQ